MLVSNGEWAESSTAAIASSTLRDGRECPIQRVGHLRGHLSQMTLEARTRRRVLSLALTNWPLAVSNTASARQILAQRFDSFVTSPRYPSDSLQFIVRIVEILKDLE